MNPPLSSAHLISFWARCQLYGWEESYHNALLETDRSKLRERIDAAQTAIDRRLQQINGGHDSAEERRAIQHAMAGLNVLRVEVSTNHSRT